MAGSLRDIPGSRTRRRRRFAGGRKRDLWGPIRRATIDLTPPGLRLERSGPRRFRPRRRVDLGLVLIGVGGLAVVGWLGFAFWGATRVDVDVQGLVSGTPFTPAHAQDLSIALRLPSSDDRFRAHLTLDGIPLLEDLDWSGDTIEVIPADLVASDLVGGALDEGDHELRLTVGRLFLADAVFRWRYAVDGTPPTITVPAALEPVDIAREVTVRGQVEPGATLTVDGERVAVDGKGSFALPFERPPIGVLHLEVTDRAGNRSRAETTVPVIYPTTSRGVHVSAEGWADEELRAGVLSLIDRGLIDTVELDLKDERGIVGYRSEVEVAQRIGATRSLYDLDEAVATLRARHVRVIGRIVAFRDPIYARAAWAAGHKDQVLQTPDGEMLGAYGGFTNYVHPAVRRYNLDLALEAVHLGVHDILWDYIRRPEGNPSTMVVPGLGAGKSADHVASFLAESHAALRARGAYQGASVFGIAAAQGDSIAQEVPKMARVVDYLAPMIYPSHWGPGQYRVPSPINDPYEITRRSLAHFQQEAAGSGVRFLPWIQDFSIRGVVYGAPQVQAQIDAAASLGIDGFLLWNPGVRYTDDALSPRPAP